MTFRIFVRCRLGGRILGQRGGASLFYFFCSAIEKLQKVKK